MSATPKPLVLIILDGFGHSDNPEYNAIHAANTPVYDRLRANYPHGLISGSGMDVGLPDGQMGNSEVGHMNLGAGRVVYQDFTRVTKAIRDGAPRMRLRLASTWEPRARSSLPAILPVESWIRNSLKLIPTPPRRFKRLSTARRDSSEETTAPSKASASVFPVS